MNLEPYKKIKIERVEDMIQFFRDLPRKHIDLGKFCAIDRTEETLAQARRPECGTIGCLGGWVVMRHGPKSWKIVNDEWGFAELHNSKGSELTWSEQAAQLMGFDLYNVRDDDLLAGLFDENTTGKSDRAEILHRLRRLLKYAKKAQAAEPEARHV